MCQEVLLFLRWINTGAFETNWLRQEGGNRTAEHWKRFFRKDIQMHKLGQSRTCLSCFSSQRRYTGDDRKHQVFRYIRRVVQKQRRKWENPNDDSEDDGAGSILDD
jgi:hypothetical protein